MTSQQDIAIETATQDNASNFVNPESLAPLALYLSVIIIILTTVFLLVRLYSNYNATRGLGWDDSFCVIATVLLFIYIAMSLSIREWARHIYDIPFSAFTSLRVKESFLAVLVIGPMTFFAKTSLFLLYYRVFAPKKLLRYIIAIGITFCFAVCVTNLAVAVHFCAPHPGKDWDLMVAYSCTQIGFFNIIAGVADLSLDIFMLGLPIPVVLQLQLPPRKKAGVLAMFMTGLLVLIASTLSLVYKVRLITSTDKIWNGYKVEICVLVETGVTILCGSMPAFASFSKAWTENSGYFTSLYFRIFPCFTPTSKDKSNLSASSETRTDPSPANRFKAHSKSHQLNFYGFEEYRGSNDYPLNRTTTEVYGAAGTDDIEDGIIRKSVTVLQSSI